MEASIDRYLLESRIPLRLSCLTSSGWPAVLSLWYLYEGGMLYCATHRKARVIEYLQNNSRCAFEIASDHPPYCGVRGPALASLDSERGPEILERLLLRYLGNKESSLARQLLQRADDEIAIRLRPQNLYSWNFTARMRDSLRGSIDKICPEAGV